MATMKLEYDRGEVIFGILSKRRIKIVRTYEMSEKRLDNEKFS